ncbi:MAG: hypothetical protein ACKVQW_06645 [Pyrinomonadaceae bacterium]
MVGSLILIESEFSVKEEALKFSLMNAKQIVIGRIAAMGWVVHVGANTHADLGKAILEFSQVPGVTGVVTLLIRNP